MVEKGLPRQVETLIIGAGPVGLAAGARAQQLRLPFVIIEKKTLEQWQLCDAQKRLGLTLSGRGLAVLGRLGLNVPRNPNFQPIRGRAIHLGLGTSSKMDYAANGTPVLYSVTRENLVNCLREHLACDENIYFGYSVEDVDLTKKVAALKSYGDGKLFKVGFTKLLACDGRLSRVREILVENSAAKITERVTGWSYVTLMGQVRHPNSQERIHVIPREEYFMVGIPHADGSVSFSVGARHLSRDLVLKAAQEISSTHLFQCTVPEDLLLRPRSFSTLLVTRTFLEGVQILGDARHQVPHLLGQGLNLGLSEMESAFYPRRDLDENAKVIAKLSEKQISLFRQALGSPYVRKLHELRLTLSQIFPRIFLNEYDLITGDHHHLGRLRLRIFCQRAFELGLGLRLAALLLTIKDVCISTKARDGYEVAA